MAAGEAVAGGFDSPLTSRGGLGNRVLRKVIAQGPRPWGQDPSIWVSLVTPPSLTRRYRLVSVPGGPGSFPIVEQSVR